MTAESVAAPEPREASKTKKILLVDDDPVILGTLSLKLKSKGYQVVTASDGSQAIGVTRKEKPDLMLLDVCFPPDVAHGGGVPWNGFLIMEWLHRLSDTSSVPVIVMSGADRVEYKQRASAAGAAAFFQKPIDNDQLLTAIDTALLHKGSVGAVKPAPVVEI
ncbi:MAG: response regulator [Verrucomicrobiota bacterium]